MPNAYVLKGGYVYDPLNGIDGEKMDVAIADGKIVDTAPKGAKVIDVSGKVVMPGGVCIHSHIAGGKVNSGRRLRPEDHRKDVVPKRGQLRSGVGYTVPSTFITGYRFAAMGYTTVFEPAVPPLKARHTHEEFQDTPILDNGGFVLTGNNWFVLNYIRNNEMDKLAAYIAWLLWATKCYAVKIVNPGGVESWGWGKNVNGLDDKVPYFDVSPREIVTALAQVNEKLGLPHTIHVHGNNLGHPGNYEITLETMEAVREVKPAKGRRNVIHFTHVQFNAYAGTSWKDFASGGKEIAEYINKHDHVTVDIGQVIFGDATTMTADGPWEFTLHQITGGNKWVNSDVELETGSGIVPYVFRRTIPVNAVQWAIGLEIMLSVNDLYKVCLTTDHPNGGPFYFYPKIISWLVSRKARNEMLEKTHKAAAERTTLKDLDREFSLYDVAIVTRATQAKILGLKNRGHLGPGAKGDVAVYDLDPTKVDISSNPDLVEKAFSAALYTFKDGEIVVKDGEVIAAPQGSTIWVKVKSLEEMMPLIEEDLKEMWKHYTVSLSNYPVQMEYLPKSEMIEVGA
ncbi:MAG: formylmethanofuran dehydrogenase subunit A [Candidatus Jordarchaeales archaeon]|nr:formylmethanofuran dehydrogenase subunit A [Candidatus Jordarchaeia archaeon]